MVKSLRLPIPGNRTLHSLSLPPTHDLLPEWHSSEMEIFGNNQRHFYLPSPSKARVQEEYHRLTYTWHQTTLLTPPTHYRPDTLIVAFWVRASRQTIKRGSPSLSRTERNETVSRWISIVWWFKVSFNNKHCAADDDDDDGYCLYQLLFPISAAAGLEKGGGRSPNKRMPLRGWSNAHWFVNSATRNREERHRTEREEDLQFTS